MFERDDEEEEVLYDITKASPPPSRPPILENKARKVQ